MLVNTKQDNAKYKITLLSERKFSSNITELYYTRTYEILDMSTSKIY